MKTNSPLLCLLAFLFAIVCPGCVTPAAPGAATNGTNDATYAAFLRTGTTVLAYEGLKNNPRYVVDAVALSAAIDVALKGDALITEETIAAFVQRIAAQRGMDQVEQLFFGGIARTAYQAFAAKYGTTGILIRDPKAQLWVGAFNDGLRDAIVVLKNPAASVVS